MFNHIFNAIFAINIVSWNIQICVKLHFKTIPKAYFHSFCLFTNISHPFGQTAPRGVSTKFYINICRISLVIYIRGFINFIIKSFIFYVFISNIFISDICIIKNIFIKRIVIFFIKRLRIIIFFINRIIIFFINQIVIFFINQIVIFFINRIIIFFINQIVIFFINRIFIKNIFIRRVIIDIFII